MRDFGFIAPARSRNNIRGIAHQIRRAFVKDARLDFPVLSVLELSLPEVLNEDYHFEVRTRQELGDVHAQALPERTEIQVREDVYLRASQGNGMDRFTLAHELGHLVLHSRVPLQRVPAGSQPKDYFSSEWQADCFAGELLVASFHQDRFTCPEDIVELCQVSISAARVQWRVLNGNR